MDQDPASLLQNIVQEKNNQLGLVSTTIGGKTYSITLLGASTGILTFQEVTKLILPAMGATVDGVASEDDILTESKTFSEASKILVSQMEDVNCLVIIKTLLHESKVDGQLIDFDTEFRGNYGVLFELVEFAFKENFSSFFTYPGLKKRLDYFWNSFPSPMEIDTQTEPSSE